ncbi:MAG: LacI family DNA-binding transcriptional regulator [Propionibacteriaceae bacterium]|nr:LacI family DNA-binding transcriptional regulator [Propionibacteriaceae bacterium]
MTPTDGRAPRPKRPAPDRAPEVANVRIRDVAERAGVSVGTVSNTINHPELVRSRTREAVQRAIRELGFVPNQQARVLTGASSQVIGLVVLDVVSPFFMEAARAVERAAQEAGHVVILCNSDNDPQKEAQLLQMLAAQRVRGALLTPASANANLDQDWIRARRLPMVFLDYQNSPEDCSVSVDDVAGARLAVAHLLSLGHEHVAFVGGGRGLRQHVERAQGAREAIAQAGLDPATALVEVSQTGLGIQDGLAAVQQLLEGKLPSGIFCGNDMMAFGVYRGLARAGVRVPDDVALVGYDDIDFAADWIVPLTSVRQPTDQLGYLAAQLLFEHSSGNAGHVHRQVVLQPELIIRSSSDPASRTRLESGAAAR